MIGNSISRSLDKLTFKRKHILEDAISWNESTRIQVQAKGSYINRIL